MGQFSFEARNWDVAAGHREFASPKKLALSLNYIVLTENLAI